MIIICLEGCDSSGKTTLIKEIHKTTNYKYPILDRFTPSSIAYAMHHGRELNLYDYANIEKNLCDKLLLVYCEADNKDIEKRMKEKKDLNDPKKSEISKLKICYEKYLNEFSYFTNVLHLDTYKNYIIQCIEKIKQEIKKLENETIIDKVNKIKKLISERGEYILNTKEILDLNITINEQTTIDIIEEYYKKEKLDFNQIEYEEKFYYNRIYNSFRHIIKAQLQEYNQSLESRRFIYTSKECIDSIHLVMRDDILYAYIHIRSSNVKKTLPLDMYYCFDITNMLNAEFFKCTNIECKFSIDSAHIITNGGKVSLLDKYIKLINN